MKINNKSISSYHASIVSFDVKTMGIDNHILLLESGYQPVSREQKLSAQERDLIIDFTSEQDISDFTVNCSGESLLDIDDGYEYVCFLKSAPSITTEGIHAFTASFPMYVIKRKPMIICNGNLPFHVEGNIWAPCVLELRASSNLAEFTIDDYKIKNIKANEVFVIDGIRKIIYRSSKPDLSAFDDTNLKVFPKLYPGNKQFQLSDSSVVVVCKYNPTYM